MAHGLFRLAPDLWSAQTRDDRDLPKLLSLCERHLVSATKEPEAINISQLNVHLFKPTKDN